MPQNIKSVMGCLLHFQCSSCNANHYLFKGQAVTLLGDDLYSRPPMCQNCLETDMNFIFTCLASSDPSLYEWLEYLDKNGEVQSFSTKYKQRKSQKIYNYRFVNQIPLRDPQPSLLVNWCELTILNTKDGSAVYYNAFVTNHTIAPDNVVEVVESAARWKTENENHNILKTKGYNLEHNFGHGEKYLSSILLTLNLLAFLFHSVLQLLDSSYQKIRIKRGTRRGFFQDILYEYQILSL